jgi:hypothetical protein
LSQKQPFEKRLSQKQPFEKRLSQKNKIGLKRENPFKNKK